VPYFQPVKFEWDHTKEAGNIVKHGVDFSFVPKAFGDPRRAKQQFFCKFG
jgi:uncharacterized DUF497 family protein